MTRNPDRPETTATPTLTERLQAKAMERAKITDQIARMLWESGPQSSDWEGGAAPSWDEITEWRAMALPDNAHQEDRDTHDAYTGYWLDTWHKAENLLRLDERQCMSLARILLDEASRKQEHMCWTCGGRWSARPATSRVALPAKMASSRGFSSDG